MVVESGDIELDIFAALTNSNVKFLGTMREFVEKIANKCNQDVEEVRKAFNYQKLATRFGEISNISFCRV